jgi:hypothetical protein
LKRVFNLDLTHCQHCGGQLRIVAAILQRQAIDKILNHLGLEAQPPPRAPARRQINDSILQPKYSGCKGGRLGCELEWVGADFSAVILRLHWLFADKIKRAFSHSATVSH